MTILEVLNRVPDDKWKLQILHECFLRGDVKKNSAAITFQTTRELGLQLNAASVIGRLEQIGLIIWVDSDAWEKAKRTETKCTKCNSAPSGPTGLCADCFLDSSECHAARAQAQDGKQ